MRSPVSSPLMPRCSGYTGGMDIITGFPFSAGGGARVLVLGSMPSRESLHRRQYYAHPRNAFWPVMGALFGAGPELPYTQRLAMLRTAGVALWDVAHRCIRPGSLDADIIEVQTNDFAYFFMLHPHIRHIFFNGRKAEEMYRRLVLPGLSAAWRDLPRTCLPSTSPAHAALSLAEKLAEWQAVRQALETAGI